MKKNIINAENCVLATDFSDLKKDQELWLEQREKKANVYQALSEYIEFLENILEHMEDYYQKYLIEKEIKKLKKQQKKYYVSPILAIARYDLVKNNEENKNALANSSFQLVKKRS